jgi:uncharacterized protein (DUF2164 family)
MIMVWKSRSDKMSEDKTVKSEPIILDKRRVQKLVEKIWKMLNKEKKYTVEEKFAAGIAYSKLISDYNHQSTEQFLAAVYGITMDKDMWNQAMHDKQNTDTMFH